jgi:LmbE family N-acetylglucosaminyl deacetylase
VTVLALEPHNDDLALFGAFTAIRERPHVITVLRSEMQYAYGISAATRERESHEAMMQLGCSWEQWGYSDRQPDWDRIRERLTSYAVIAAPEHVYAPRPEPGGGHEHHDWLGTLAVEVFGPGRVTWYLTYTRHGGKSTDGECVLFDPAWVSAKLRALACFRSQIETPEAGCVEHFLRDQHEYVARP